MSKSLHEQQELSTSSMLSHDYTAHRGSVLQLVGTIFKREIAQAVREIWRVAQDQFGKSPNLGAGGSDVDKEIKLLRLLVIVE